MPKTQLNTRQLHTEGDHDVATDDEVHAAIQAHEAATDPHHQYLLRSEYHEGTSNTDLTQIIQQLTQINTEILAVIATDTALSARITALEDHEAHEDDHHHQHDHHHHSHAHQCCRPHCTCSCYGHEDNSHPRYRGGCCRSGCDLHDCVDNCTCTQGCAYEPQVETETRGSHSRHGQVKIRLHEFLDRFTIVERAVIKVWIDRYTARKTTTLSPDDQKVGAFCVVAQEYLGRQKKVDLRDYNVISLVNQYELYGIIEDGRAVQILTTT